MNEAGVAVAPVGTPGVDPAGNQPRVAALRQRGAAHFDAVRFRHIEALARRAATQPAEVQRRLQPKLVQAMQACAAQCDTARAQADQVLARLTAQHPASAAALKRLQAKGDFSGLQGLVAQLAARPARGPLGQMLDAVNPSGLVAPPPGANALFSPPAPAPGELKALRQFRATWARLRAEQQLARSLAQAPQNPGPINSHSLVLRSLQLMQTLSPAYLNHFMAHAEALLWLDQASAGGAPAVGKALRRDTDKPRRSGRTKPGQPGG